MDHPRQDPHQVARDSMISAPPADRPSARLLAAAKDLVAVAGMFEVELEHARRRHPRLAPEDVSVPVRHERDVPGWSWSRVLLVDLEQDRALGDVTWNHR